MFPNFGLLWERTLDEDLGALTANMTAWNRWCASVVADGRGRVHPGRARDAARRRVAARASSRDLERAGVHLAMIAPALVDGRPLSHPDHDRDLARVRRARRHAGVPRRRSAPRVRRRVVHGARRRWSAAARLGLPLDRGRARVHRPHPERHARTASRAAHRHRRAVGGLGADVPDDARRRHRVHDPPQRPAGVPAAR